MFFALKGPNFDGNQFAKEAIEKGALYAVVNEKNYALNDHYILVKNVLKTLQGLAHLHRQNFNIPLLAITGTNGKTTTKELICAVLSKKYNTYATQGNLNNHIGVPLTLLSIPTSPPLPHPRGGTDQPLPPTHYIGETEEYVPGKKQQTDKTTIELSKTEDISHETESLSIQQKEKELIIKALKKNNNKRKYAARDLEISERTLYRKIKQYDLED